MVGPFAISITKPSAGPLYLGPALSCPKPPECSASTTWMVASLTTVVPPMFIPSAFCAPIRLASSYEVMTLAPVCLASSAVLPTWSKWPWVTRMASSALGCSIFGALGLSSQGSIAIVAPAGVVMMKAACPHQVATAPPGAGAAAAGAAAGAAAAGVAVLSAANAPDESASVNEKVSGNLSVFMGSLLVTKW